MKNEIKTISDSAVSDIRNCEKGAYTVELDGKTIHTEKEWLYAMAEAFRFPVYTENDRKTAQWYSGAYKDTERYLMNHPRYSDWMTDLSWISEERIVLIVKDFPHIFDGDPDAKEYLLKDLRDILHWWDTEVVNCVVEGQKREFTVYLTDKNK